MNLRHKTKQRLLILITGVICVTGAAIALILVQLHRHEEHRLMFRAAAMAAFQRGDYRTAADNFANYLRNDRMDSQAIFDYGVARSKLPQADAKNLLEARDAFKLYLELNPGDIAGEHQLLDIYRKLQYSSEASDLSNTLLQQNPDDVPALLAKLTELVQQQQYQTALPVAFHLNELTPFDVQTQGTTYELMWHLQKPKAELIDRADQMVKAHPNDPRFELLRAVAAYWTGDVEGSKHWLRTAAKRTPPDGDFVLMLAGAFDHVGLWTEALDLLQANARSSSLVEASLLQRLWELGRFDQALKLTAVLNPADPKADSNLIGLKAFTLYGKSRSASMPLPPDFSAAVESLRQRQDDMPAQCWASLLSAITQSNPTNVMKPVQLCQNARRSDPTNSDACYFLGRAYLRIGESELALQAFKQTTQFQPEWAAPEVLISQILSERGELDSALRSAIEAVARDPQSMDAQIALAKIRYQQIPSTADAAEILPVLNVTEQLLKSGANDGDLSVAKIDLLARSNQFQQAQADALELLATCSISTLKRLAAVDQADHLGIEKQLTDRLNQCHPTLPNEALDQIEAGIILGNNATANSLLSSMQTRPTPGWQTAWLQAREAMGDPTVVTGWAQLADLDPNDLDVQKAILHSSSAKTNRALIDRTIDRLKAITGDDAIEWKLARANWQLGGTDDQKTSANAAATSMAELVRVAPAYATPQVIWADALEKLGDPVGAIAHLRLAVQIEPDNAGLILKLAKLHLEQNQFQELRALLARVRANARLGNSQRLDAAMLYRQTGDRSSAMKLLQDAAKDHSVDCDLLLAQLHAELGEDADAEQIYNRWLAQDPHNPRVLQAAAGFMARRGDLAQAREKLSAIPAAEKNLIEGEFESQWGNLTVAAADFQKSTAAEPDNVHAWLEWAGMNLRHRDFSGAFSVASEGLKHLPAHSLLTAMKDCAQALAGLPLEGDSQDLLNNLSVDPGNEAAVATLAALSDSETPGDAIEKLRSVAEKYPRFLPVETLIIRKDFQAGLFDQAADRATRVCALLPIEAEPAQLLTRIYSAAHQWDRALAAAAEWRSRSLDHPHPADIAIASAQIALQQPQRAESQLAWCLRDPTSDEAAIDVYARALCTEGRVDQAWTIFQPYTNLPGWRQRWLHIVSTGAMDPTAALRYVLQISPQCQARSADDQLALCEAWYTLGMRLNDPSDLEKAKIIAVPLTALQGNRDAWLLLGNIQQQQNDLSSAEISFSNAVKVSPDNAVAKNNLAMVMWLRNEDLKAARELATLAVSMAPAESSFHSTLAEINLQMNKLEAAKLQFQIAARLNVENAEALIGTAAVEDQAGNTGNVKEILAQAQSILNSTHPILPAKVREEFHTLQGKYFARPATGVSQSLSTSW